MKAYIASPLGFADSTREFLKKIHELLEKHGFEVLDPWDQDYGDLFREAEKLEKMEERRIYLHEQVNQVIGRKNADLICQSDVLVAVLDGSDVDSGTASEIGFAFGLGKTIIGLRTDFRLAADNLGSTVNLQVEYFIEESSGERICRSLEELDESLRSLAAVIKIER